MMNIIGQVQSFISANIKMGASLLALVKLEARLAGLSVFPLILTCCMLGVILLSSWIALMLLFGCLFFFIWKNLALATAIILILNLILLVILLNRISVKLRNMSFEKTREFFSNYKRRELEEAKQNIEKA